MNRLTLTVAAVALLAASLLMLWLAFFPSGLGEFFGDDDFEPLSGFVFVGLTVLACGGILRWSRLRWLGVAIALVGALFWVAFILNTKPAGPSPVLAGLYVLATAALLTSIVVDARER